MRTQFGTDGRCRVAIHDRTSDPEVPLGMFVRDGVLLHSRITCSGSARDVHVRKELGMIRDWLDLVTASISRWIVGDARDGTIGCIRELVGRTHYRVSPTIGLRYGVPERCL